MHEITIKTINTMRKSRFLLFAITIALLSIQMSVTAAVPSGAIAAKPNIIFWAGAAPTFYDAQGNKLMSYSGLTVLDATNTVIWTNSSKAGAEYGWSATPANTAWATGVNSSNYYEYPNFDNTKTPTCNIDQYMRPFWVADTIYNELVKLTGVNSTAKLMFTPKKIISVTNYDFSKTFISGTDYSVAGRTITQKTATVSSGYAESVGKNNLSNVNPTSWTCVTYIPDRTGWGGGNIFTNQSSKFPKTMAKLQAKQPVTVVAFGMSITAGLNTSGFAGDKPTFVPTKPYMHSYVDMFCDKLKKIYGSTITNINGSCGGKTVAWTDAMVTSLVTPNNPDLVLLDQGMNDIWGTSNAAFKASMQSAINKIKTACPNAEIILINNMIPGTGVGSPDANNMGSGPALMRGLRDQLQALEGPGVVNFPMTQMSDSVFARKGEAGCISNSLHPNDYLARWYAQGLVEMFYHTPANPSTPTDVIAPTESAIATNFITVTPNPVVDGHFILKIADDVVAENAIISVYDLAGKQVASFKQSSSSKDYISSDLNMSSGVYIFKAQVDGKVSTQKVVVK